MGDKFYLVKVELANILRTDQSEEWLRTSIFVEFVGTISMRMDYSQKREGDMGIGVKISSNVEVVNTTDNTDPRRKCVYKRNIRI